MCVWQLYPKDPALNTRIPRTSVFTAPIGILLVYSRHYNNNYDTILYKSEFTAGQLGTARVTSQDNNVPDRPAVSGFYVYVTGSR